MRISDNLITKSYLANYNRTKELMSKIQQEIATRSKINNPSDSPAGISRLFRLNNNLDSNNVFLKNIENSLSFVSTTTGALQEIEDSTKRIVTTLIGMENPVIGLDYKQYADQLESELKTILMSANAEFDGKYLFGGTDFSSKPFDFSTNNEKVERLVEDSADHQVVISKSLTQKINLTGQEVFGVVIKQAGNIDSTATSPIQSNHKIYDETGNEYDFKVIYTKTAADTYDMDYEIWSTGSTPVKVYSDTKEVKFYSSSGFMASIDGNEVKQFRITDSAHNIDFVFDPTTVTQKATGTNLSVTENQKRDIFNTLNGIIKKLRNNELPSSTDKKLVEDFLGHLINKQADTGNIINSLTSVRDLMENQNTELQSLISLEKDVDVAKAVVDLNTQDYKMQTLYKMSSMILPKSLLDYL